MTRENGKWKVMVNIFKKLHTIIVLFAAMAPVVEHPATNQAHMHTNKHTNSTFISNYFEQINFWELPFNVLKECNVLDGGANIIFKKEAYLNNKVGRVGNSPTRNNPQHRTKVFCFFSLIITRDKDLGNKRKR
jgi:hypothetical protein